jgi:prepilin-type N-terminal cleavage/methylation domain-containing protein
MKNKSGFTIIELLIVLVIFSIIMAGLFSVYQVHLRQQVKEFRRGQTSMEDNIAITILERDLVMAGYGLAEDYSQWTTNSALLPYSARATNDLSANGDTLRLRGTAIYIDSEVSQRWEFVQSLDPLNGYAPTFANLQRNESDEELKANNVVVMMETTAKQLQVLDANNWSYKYTSNTANVRGVNSNADYVFNPLQSSATLYGMHTDPASMPAAPYYTIDYSVLDYDANTRPINCAPGTRALRRNSEGNSQPLFNCVLDFQVAFGLDTNDDGELDMWDNGGNYAAATYTGMTGPTVLNRCLKQIRVYILVQDGGFDPGYTYPTDRIRNGELTLMGGATGRDVDIAALNLKNGYKWKVISLAVTPRNIR